MLSAEARSVNIPALLKLSVAKGGNYHVPRPNTPIGWLGTQSSSNSQVMLERRIFRHLIRTPLATREPPRRDRLGLEDNEMRQASWYIYVHDGCKRQMKVRLLRVPGISFIVN